MTSTRAPKVYIRGADKVIRGTVAWQSLRIEWVHNAVTPWSFTVQDRPRIEEMVERGGGAVIAWDENLTFSGRFEENGPRTWAASGENAGTGHRTLAGSDDMKIIANCLLLPNPAGATFETACGGATYDVRSGPAESVVKGFVDANCGTGRPTWRNDGIPDLDLITVAADQGRGLAQKFSARMSESMPTLRLLAKYYAPGPPALGFTLTVLEDPNTGQLVFETTPQRDLTGVAVFSERMGNLTEATWQEAAATATHAIVGGSGSGTSRTFKLVKDTVAAYDWRQPIEVFVDRRDTTDATELTNAGQQQLDSGKVTGLLSATCVDTPRLRFGQHFTLGDLVTVEVRLGVAYQGTVTKAVLEADASGKKSVTLTVSPFGVTGDETNDTSVIYKKIAELERQIQHLQAAQ